MSKAAVRFRSTRTAESPESTVKIISLKTLKRAVSVLWCGLKPDWNFSYTSLLIKNVCNWLTTTFSRILDRKGSLEMGLKLGSQWCGCSSRSEWCPNSLGKNFYPYDLWLRERNWDRAKVPELKLETKLETKVRQIRNSIQFNLYNAKRERGKRPGTVVHHQLLEWKQ